MDRESTKYLNLFHPYLNKVAKLQRASLQNPVKVEVSSKYQTVDKLQQYYLFIPVKYKVHTTKLCSFSYMMIELS